MESDPVRNALSRRLNVYICDECGMMEALEDMLDAIKAPLSAWAIAKEPARWGAVSYTHLSTGCSRASSRPAFTRAWWTDCPAITESGRAK